MTLRDEVVDFLKHLQHRSGLSLKRLLGWLGLAPGKYHEWQRRYGQANQHNGLIPRDFYLLSWEQQVIVEYARTHPDEGYRRMTYMMLDAGVVSTSPSTVYRVLKSEGLLQIRNNEPSRKGQGFDQPKKPHEHWHIDISYINVAGTFFYLCSILDGYSRYIVAWVLKPQMLERDVELVLQKGHEAYPQARPRVISDNGPQFIARDFKEYIRDREMTHVRTSPFYPQSNGKLERWHQSLKVECIRRNSPVSEDDAQALIGAYIIDYNDVRLHSAVGYVTPKDKLEGREEAIFAARKVSLDAARAARKVARQTVTTASLDEESEPHPHIDSIGI